MQRPVVRLTPSWTEIIPAFAHLPALPTHPTSGRPASLSHKYPGPLAFAEVELRFVVPSPCLADFLRTSAFWLAVLPAK